MAAHLPELSRAEFDRRLTAVSPVPLANRTLEILFVHFQELRRWTPVASLIGPGTVDQVMARHYGESLAALELVESPGCLVDIGSGAGFPGFVLAAALPEVEATLVESRAKKCSFLRAAARKAGLPCRCLNARVESSLPPELPGEIGLLTVRAVRLEARIFRAFVERLTPSAQILIWAGERTPELPTDQFAAGRSVQLPGTRRRRILEFRLRPAVEPPPGT